MIKNARYMGELTKFGHRFGAPPALALSAIKNCLEDFSGHNIDVCCLLFETYPEAQARKNEEYSNANCHQRLGIARQ